MVKILVTAGARADHHNEDLGVSPVHVAAINDNLAAMRLTVKLFEIILIGNSILTLSVAGSKIYVIIPYDIAIFGPKKGALGVIGQKMTFFRNLAT